MIFNESNFNKHWALRELRELGTFTRGKSRHRPRNDKRLFESGKIPLIQTGEIKSANLYIREHQATYNEFGLKQSKLWPKETLCITIAANIAETALLGYPMCFPDSVVGFNADPNESSEVYLHYVFTYIRHSIRNATSGSIQDNINIEFLTGLKFRIPEKSYQDRIVNILSTLDAKIDLNRRINAELEAMAKLLYDYWFVQFDFPISAAQAAAMGRPDLEGKPYRDSGGKMVHHPELKREIPEGWVCKELIDIANITMGQSPPGHSYNESGEGELFFQGSTDFGWRFPSPRQYTTAPTRIANEGDILLSVRAPVGTLNIAPARCAIGRGLAALNSKLGHAPFLFRVMENLRTVFDRRNTDGTTFGSINRDDLRSLKLSYPADDDLVRKFDERIKPMEQLIFTNHLQEVELTQLRDWLLPMLMNGQVSVGDPAATQEG
jgi:type I restriction enzyme, S subunit